MKQEIETILKVIGLNPPENVDTSAVDLTNDQFLLKQLEWSNKITGDLNEKDGYDCKICLNRGFNHELRNSEIITVPCKCIKIRKSISILKASGLENNLKKFSEYTTVHNWQMEILAKAKKFAALNSSRSSAARCFYIGGQSGAGKTHICTAISRELMLNCRELLFMRWVTEIEHLKDYDDISRYQKADKFSNVEILYIDDLFKPSGGGGLTQPDIRKTFDIINRRYEQPDKVTIISGERTFHELKVIDDATAGRIYEMSAKGEFVINIPKDDNKNYRYGGREAI